jgi:hypothetical protein
MASVVLSPMAIDQADGGGSRVNKQASSSNQTVRICKSWGFHGGDYEECRLLVYTKPSSYLLGDTLRLRYRPQPVNAM